MKMDRKKVTLSGVAISEVGQIREINEDRYLLKNRAQVYAVADGVGGLPFGEKASECAIKVVERILGKSPMSVQSDTDILRAVLIEANESVYNLGQIIARDSGIGTTLTVIQNIDGYCHVGHVGDSQVLLMNEDHIHSIVQEHVRVIQGPKVRVFSGNFEKEIYAKPRRVLDRYIGQSKDLEPERFYFRLSCGDRILMCTDGISSVVSTDEIHSIHRVKRDCREFLKALYFTINNRGGPDNFTGISLRVLS